MASRAGFAAQAIAFILLFLSISVSAAEVLGQAQYKVGEPIPVSCMNRTIETGEHVEVDGRLQYIPFPVCNETGRPLELYFGVERDVNCTIDFIDDTFYHLLEFYVHSDAPLTCRVPARPITGPVIITSEDQIGVLGSESNKYVPFVIALTGVLDRSHLHVSNNLNVLLHAAPKRIAPGVVDSAIAYSYSHLTRRTKVIIGEALPLRFTVRWYPSTNLPSGWAGVGGHLFLSTLIYCLLSAGAAAAICVAYFRGIELPRRLQSYGRERAFGNERATRYTGYGYGVGNGYGYSGPGKQD